VSKALFFKRMIMIVILLVSVSLGVYGAIEHSLLETGIPSFDVISPYVDSNKYTHEKSDQVALNQQAIFDEYLELDTDAGTVYLDEASLAFQIVNDNGYIWSSTIDYDVEGYPNTFKQRARSAIILESYNNNTTSFAITEENLFTDARNVIDVDLVTNGFHATITFGKSDITIGLTVLFTGNQIKVSIPEDEIVESGDFKISSIKVYPYFGAVLEDDIPGYVFLPDGVGALVDYKPTNPLIGTNYQKEIYDRNVGYNLTENMNEFISGGTKIYAPVFGFVHGVDQNAVFANITSGSEYGVINLYFPSRTRGFTTVFSEFVFRKPYSQPIDKIGNTISLLQQFNNSMDIEIEYTLLDGGDANYVGMAKTYRSYLEDSLQSDTELQNDIPLKLDVIGIEKTKGLLFDKTIVMTTFNQMKDIVTDLESKGISNIIANYQGFTSSGVTWSAPKYERISSRLGNTKDLEALSLLLTDLYFVTEFNKASNQSGGYNQYFDLAKKINDQLYQYYSGTDIKFLLEYQQVEDVMEESMDRLSDYPMSGFAIESMGNLLYDDFSNQRYLPDLIQIYHEMLSSTELNIALYDVNAYLWDSIDNFYDFPMYSSQYVTLDDTVPFMSIVLSGSISLFGPNANFYPYARDELLRLVDFNVYPSFVVTHESSKKLQDTGLESIYSSRYEDIKLSVSSYYDFVNEALKYVIGSTIENREVYQNGVMEITYANGVIIVVNYTNQIVMYETETIAPKSYLVTGSVDQG
jgi:hypothetical protein